MALKKRICSIGRTAKISLTALALAAVAPATATAAPAPAPAAIPAADSIQASYNCSYTRVSDERATVTCTVRSGAIRLRVRCSDGRVIVTPWWNPGTWYVVIDCYPAEITGIWIDSLG
ncbi:hypothetical protein SAMN04489727_8298 [Amycolatopsis tolypomycina]|uniref:Secreted protein n=1 Tax=Amycolatopsis tolypomycina TaxID=208445 RepID=A0A1H5BIP8_9PSEU|nr:hypothetical protein [Amycolatopsis tolypomycina]SED54255.1 hypothetical protein SAMN04489727_8298 [Amycolatopsis tolypomycina]